MTQVDKLAPVALVCQELPKPMVNGPATAAETPQPVTNPLLMVVGVLALVAVGLYLFGLLAPLLRPLFMAIFLCYVIIPIHNRFTLWLSPATSFLAIAGASLALILFMILLVQTSLLALEEDLPTLLVRAREISQQTRDYWTQHFPWLSRLSEDAGRLESYGAKQPFLGDRGLLDLTAQVLTETVEACFFLIFLLVDIPHWPRRIRDSFPGSRAEHILEVVGRINEAMAHYLRLKVRSSLLLAVPATLLLAAFGVKFPLLWGVLTFFGNFIPYLGSLVACLLPLLLAFLQLPDGWQPWVLAGLLSTLHLSMHYLIEPVLIGKVIDLSPLVILAALSFWGLSWGLSGMLLAIPLTVMLKIVLDNIEATRPVARLLAEE